MPAILTNYKVELAKRGRKIRDLAETLGMPYNKISRVLNGYDSPAIDFDKNVLAVLKKWDSENTSIGNRDCGK